MHTQQPQEPAPASQPTTASEASTDHALPTGPVAAVLLGTGIGSLVLAVLVVIAEANESFADSLAYSQRVGPLSGKTIWAVAAFLASSLVLGLALRNRDVDLRKVTLISGVMLAIALVGTFSPFFELFAPGD